MRVLITGAEGFIGRALAARLQARSEIGSCAVRSLNLLDTQFPPGRSDAGMVRYFRGSIADKKPISDAWGDEIDIVFHLASIPGGAAEQNYALSRDVNIHGTIALLEAAKSQTEIGKRAPLFVFASTIAVFGSPLSGLINDNSALNPQMTYGSQKLIGETLVADFSRRKWLDGRSLRLAGVLARPPAATGQLSAFLSDIIRELSNGRRFVCPMSPSATTWAASIHNVVDNLIHAAALDETSISGHRTITLPALRFSIAQLVDAIAASHGESVRDCVQYKPDTTIETLFGRYPLLETRFAESVGFRHDGDLATLVRRAVEPSADPNARNA